jgi:uncharacterized membrane protein
MYKIIAGIVLGLMLYIFLTSFVVMSGIKVLGLIIFGIAAGLFVGSYFKKGG